MDKQVEERNMLVQLAIKEKCDDLNRRQQEINVKEAQFEVVFPNGILEVLMGMVSDTPLQKQEDLSTMCLNMQEEIIDIKKKLETKEYLLVIGKEQRIRDERAATIAKKQGLINAEVEGNKILSELEKFWIDFQLRLNPLINRVVAKRKLVNCCINGCKTKEDQDFMALWETLRTAAATENRKNEESARDKA